MSEFPFGYKIIPSVSWAYLSSLLMLALYFKFNRFWSMRNLDLLLIILLAPGLLMVNEGDRQKRILDEIDNAAPHVTDADNDSIDEGGLNLSKTKIADEFNAANSISNVDSADEFGGKTPVTDEVEESRLQANRLERNGYIFLFCIAGFFAIRMLVDPMMVRRPLLEPNLSFGGLTFLGVSLLLFLMINVTTSDPTPDDLSGAQAAVDLIERRAADEPASERLKHGPGYRLLYLLPTISTFVADDQPITTKVHSIQKTRFVTTAKVMAIMCQLAIVLGIFYIGYLHFDNARMGVGIATLYLMLPYTAEMTGRVIHVLPAALLIWAIACYRRPWLSGTFVGLATGVFYYPLFLLPLWLSFYWLRGRWRFLAGVVSMIGALALSLLFVSADFSDYVNKLAEMFGVWKPRMAGLQGIWALGWDSVYRLPMLAGFVVLSVAFALWPAQKNLGTLICCSAALMAVVQFWHGYGGGLLMGWYLPLGLLVIFRPNLDDRIALAVLAKSWLDRKKAKGEDKLRPAA